MTCLALGGSTNLILHPRSPLRRGGVDITTFAKSASQLLADVKPFGKYSMNYLIRIGGIRPTMKPC